MRLIIIAVTLCISTSAIAQTITCDDRTIGMVINDFRSLKDAESWYPKTVRITDTTVQFGTGNNSWYLERKNIGQDHLNAKTADPSLYKFKYNKNTNRLFAQAVAGAGYRASALYYKDCTYSSGQSNIATPASSNAAASYFKQMSMCDRKYVQQFLKGQGTYNGSIDGLWGRGTANGLNSLKKTGKFRNLSDFQTLKRLETNALCDSAIISQSPSLNDECLAGRSYDGTSKLTVSFVNNFSGPVEIVWLNYEGQQVSYGIIEPNQVWKQQTMITHPWAFISPTTGNCIGYYNPKVGDDNKKISIIGGYTSSGY